MTTPAPFELLDLDDVKADLRVTSTLEDTTILNYITDAQDFVEREAGIVLTSRTMTLTATGLGRFIELDKWPITSVVQVRYPAAGVMTELDGSAWTASLTRRPARVIPAIGGWGLGRGWGFCGAGDFRLRHGGYHGLAELPVEIDVVAGYDDIADVPPIALRTMRLLIAHWYENRAGSIAGDRAAAIELPFGVTPMINRLKRRTL